MSPRNSLYKPASNTIAGQYMQGNVNYGNTNLNQYANRNNINTSDGIANSNNTQTPGSVAAQGVAQGVGAAAQMAGAVGSNILQNKQTESLQKDAQYFSGLKQMDENIDTSNSIKLQKTKVKQEEQQFELEKLQDTFANRLDAMKRDIAETIRKSTQRKTAVQNAVNIANSNDHVRDGLAQIWKNKASKESPRYSLAGGQV